MKKIFIILSIILCLYGNLTFSQDVKWTNSFRGSGDMIVSFSAIDDLDNQYLAGTYSGTISNGISTLTSRGAYDVFLAKYDKNGNFDWIKSAGNVGADLAFGVVVTPDDKNIFITGYFQNTIKFSTTDSLISTGSLDVFLAKYDSSGTVIWAKNVGSNANNQRPSAMLLHNSNLVIAGSFSSSINFGTNSLTTSKPVAFYLAKFDFNGTDLQVKKIEASNGTTGIDRIFSIDKGTDGYYFGGYYQDTVFFSSGTLISPGNQNAFLLKTDFSFNDIWIRKINGSSADYVSSVTTDLLGNVFVGCTYNSPSLSIDSTASLKSAFTCPNPLGPGNSNIMWAKYTSSGNLVWLNYATNNGSAQIYRALSRQNTFTIAGYFSGQLNVKGKNLISNGGKDFFGLVFDKDNNLIYAIGFGGTGDEVGETSLIGSRGNFIFAGDYTSPSFSIGSNTLTNQGLRDMFLVKYNKGSLDITKTNPACHGSSNGSISANPAGTVSTPFTYAWTKIGDGSFNKTTQSITGLSAGSYIVDFHDVFNFEVIDTVTLVDPAQLSISKSSSTDISCYNGTDGKISTTVSGGTATYTYNWSTPDGGGISMGSQNQTTLMAGTYNDTVTDSKGCKAGLTAVVLMQPLQVSATVDSIKCVTIQGAGDGKIYITPNGGTSPYTFHWSNGATTEDITNASGGTYTVLVKDSKLCISDTIPANMCEPGVLLIQDTLVKNITCNGLTNGIIKTYASGGVTPYTFSWTKNGASYPAPDTNSLYTLTPGTYVVKVTDNSSAHAQTRSITLSQPAVLAVALTPVNVTCNGLANGSISSVPTGGTLPYSYLWTETAVPAFSKTTPSISSLSPGTYNLTVTDKKGCTALGSKDIIEPAVLSISNAVITNQSCNNGTHNGSIVIGVAGGTPSYTETWSNGKSGLSINLLAPGTYSVTITDSKGCSFSTEYPVGEPNAFSTTTRNSTNPLCYGDATGNINLCLSGNNPPYNFTWSNGHSNSNVTCDLVSSLSAGSYSVSVIDTKGCGPFLDTLTLSDPDSIFIMTNSARLFICNGDSNGFIHPGVTGGTGPGTYTYNWSPNGESGQISSGLPGGTFMLTVTDTHNCVNTKSWTITELNPVNVSEILSFHTDNNCFGDSTGKFAILVSGGAGGFQYKLNSSAYDTITYFTSLPATGYSITAKDSIGCLGSTSVTLTQPAVLNATPTFNPPKCVGDSGAIELCITGGVAPYFIHASNGFEDTFNSCTNIVTLPPGMYSATLLDANNCGATKDSMILTRPDTIKIGTVSMSNNLCFGATNGSIVPNVTGGTGPGTYNYNWSPGGASSSSLTNVGAGSYSLLVTDTNNCTGSIAWTLTELPSALQLSKSFHLDNKCFDDNMGEFAVSVLGGSGHYLIKLNSGGFDTVTYFKNLPSGSYTVTLEDSANHSCSLTTSDTIRPLAALYWISLDSTQSQLDQGTGTITASVGGGTSPYLYTLSPGSMENSSSGSVTFSSLDAGTYTIMVTDSNACILNSDNIIISITGIKNLNNKLAFRIYPSPFRSTFTLEIGSARSSRYTVELYNVIGQAVYSRNIETTIGGNVTESFNLSKLPSGVYLVKLMDGTSTITRKILKQQ